MSRPWRHAIVGMGVIGEWHARVVQTLLPNSSLTAICDLDQNKLERISAPTAKFTDQNTMLEKLGDQIDVLHVCTPSGNHLEPAIAAMEAGKHVICEKPLEITLDRIDRMIDGAKKGGVRLAGVFQNRWNPANRAIKDAVAQNRFGTLAYAGCFTPWYRTDQYYRDGGWRGTHKLDGGGAMMNQSIHAIDLLQWIAGPVKTVTAHAGSRIHPEIEVEDTLVCSLQFASGAYGIIMGSTAMYPGLAVRLEVGGSDGTAVSEGDLKIFQFRESRDDDQKLLTPKVSGSGGARNPSDLPLWLHAENIKSILQAWEQGRDPETDGPESRRAVAITLAMYESARQGGAPVRVP